MPVARFLIAAALILGWSTGYARDGAGLGREWRGYFSGTVSFDSAFPPRGDFLSRDDGDRLPGGGPPIRVSLAIGGGDEGGPSLWLAIANGPIRTGPDGETLPFDHLKLENGKLRTETEFRQADSGAWWRYVTLSPAPEGLSVLIWVFDGSGARSWSGLVRRED